MNPILCGGEVPYFLIFDFSTRPLLLFYTYIPAIIISLFLGFFVFKKDNKSLVSKLLFLITLFFSLWVLDILILWVASFNDALMFGWQITPIFEIPLFIFSIYFSLVMTNKDRKDISLNLKLFFIGLMAMVFVILPTYFNITKYDISSCEGKPGLFWYFMYGGEIFSIILMAVIFIKRFLAIPKSDIFGKEILYTGISITSFLVLFSGSNIIGQITGIQEISFFGSLGMVIFLGFLTYMIVKFQTFHIKVFATQALVVSTALLIGSQMFYSNNFVDALISIITFIVFIISGIFLIKSVKKEIQQREELAKLNIDLKLLLKQKESLVHLVNHKIKGFFTHSKYIFDGLLEGMFGEINEKVKKIAQQGLDSDNLGIETIDLTLNAANMEKGLIKYNMKVIDFKSLVDKTIQEKKILIESKGLKLEINIKPDVYNISGDAVWLKEVSNNLVENAIKYTQEGTITVGLEKNENKILFYVKDTGVGINEEDKKNLFKEGGRGRESVKINIDSTGYGLYSVKLILDAHKGRVWMESNKDGHGSTFFVELDAV